jgi:hypothetical protein
MELNGFSDFFINHLFIEFMGFVGCQTDDWIGIPVVKDCRIPQQFEWKFNLEYWTAFFKLFN